VDRFSALADQPLAWEITAAHFIVAANELVTLEAAATPAGFSWSDSGSNWPVLLLYATAAENLLKAIRVAQGEPVTSVLKRLFERGWISDPVSKAKSVVLSADARKRSEELFLKHFGRSRVTTR
jgi:hypothetical protein